MFVIIYKKIMIWTVLCHSKMTYSNILYMRTVTHVESYLIITHADVLSQMQLEHFGSGGKMQRQCFHVLKKQKQQQVSGCSTPTLF